MLLAAVAASTAPTLLLAAGVSDRPARAAVVRLGAAPVAVLAAATAGLADPFERLVAPALEGRGLTPILEHPAMAVHPPLLYAGLVATLPAFAVAAVGLAGARVEWAALRRCLLLAVALLTAAMALGGLWSYAEAGWGGYWAWDPVENTSLAPWLAALVAVHVGRSGRARGALALTTLPWILVMAGAAMTRSGATPSVHTFAESDRLGIVLSVLTVATAAVAIGCLWVGRRSRGVPTSEPGSPVASTGAALLGAAALVVLVGTAAPVGHRLAGDEGVAVGGWFFADLVAPLALVGALVLGVTALRGRRRATGVAVTVALAAGVGAALSSWPPPAVLLAAGGAFVTAGAVVAAALFRRPAWVAHAGLGVLLLGVAGTLATVERTVTLERGASTRVGGVTAANAGVDVVPGPRPGTTAVAATVLLDDGGALRQVTASLVAYPDQGGVLAETARWSRPWHDVQVALVRADDDQRALLTVRVRPAVSLVWLGALVIIAGTLMAALSGGRQHLRRGRARGSVPRFSRPAVPAYETEAREKPQ